MKSNNIMYTYFKMIRGGVNNEMTGCAFSTYLYKR